MPFFMATLFRVRVNGSDVQLPKGKARDTITLRELGIVPGSTIICNV